MAVKFKLPNNATRYLARPNKHLLPNPEHQDAVRRSFNKSFCFAPCAKLCLCFSSTAGLASLTPLVYFILLALKCKGKEAQSQIDSPSSELE